MLQPLLVRKSVTTCPKPPRPVATCMGAGVLHMYVRYNVAVQIYVMLSVVHFKKLDGPEIYI